MFSFNRALVTLSILAVSSVVPMWAYAADTCEAFEVNSSARELEQSARLGEMVVTYDVKVVCLSEQQVANKCTIVVINGDTAISCPKTTTK